MARREKKALPSCPGGGGVCRVVTGVFGREQLLSLLSSAGCVKREREGVCVKIHSTPPLYISSCCCVEWGERKQTEVFYYCQENVNLNVQWSKWHRQDTHSPHEKDFDGSVRPTGGLRLWYLLAHPLCRSGKAWNPTVIKGGSFPKDLRR